MAKQVELLQYYFDAKQCTEISCETITAFETEKTYKAANGNDFVGYKRVFHKAQMDCLLIGFDNKHLYLVTSVGGVDGATFKEMCRKHCTQKFDRKKDNFEEAKTLWYKQIEALR